MAHLTVHLFRLCRRLIRDVTARTGLVGLCAIALIVSSLISSCAGPSDPTESEPSPSPDATSQATSPEVTSPAEPSPEGTSPPDDEIVPSPEVTPPETNPDAVPDEVVTAVKSAIAADFTVDQSNLELVRSEPQTWSDGCLGLAQPDEFCTQALVAGWRVVVSNDQQTWTYRTDVSGQAVRLEAADNPASNSASSSANETQ
jgi:hypothetical protein